MDTFPTVNYRLHEALGPSDEAKPRPCIEPAASAPTRVEMLLAYQCTTGPLRLSRFRLKPNDDDLLLNFD
jgi:hypothetical protein